MASVRTAPATSDSVLSPRYRATTLGMVALVSLIAFEALAVATAMPTVARELDGLRLYALAFGGTLATSVIGMTVAGRWSDLRGPAAPLWTGLLCFVCGLLLAGFAASMPMLLAGRLVQGLGAGAISVALYVLVARMYPQAIRPRIFAAFSAGWVVPSLIGPSISGLIVEHVGWRWVFLAVPLLALPSAALLLPALRRLSPPPTAARSGSAPLLWSIGAAAGVCLLYLGGQQQGVAAAATVLPALALLLTCAWRLLPRGTLRAARGLPSVIALRGIAASAFFGCEAFLPLLLSRERGLSPTWAGVALSVGALGWFAGSWHQGHHGRDGTRLRGLRVGSALMTLGVAVTALALLPAVPAAVAIGGWTATGLGMGLIYPTLSVLTLTLSPPAQQGANSSALQLSEAIAVATTLAIGGSLFAALLAQSVTAAYLSTFAVAALLALLGLGIAGRTQAAAPR
ncbi:MFS transporter [Xanthomonas sp. NCPPB 2654]|uniref:MFS transporter n=1 Tax=unclassified Xanthomonas TaxID=2643310 RepID=UPI0021E00683|nr:MULTISPECIES: MFS transporter [unclassified Xanthomonas]MDL5365047.1 MFS transporter [Xanthomonas sp. NCPPB 2654]UYC22919.1 MFS transporter [Xanthomonas sp. CFBP 8443]